MNKAPTKLQIETAEKLLVEAFTKKRNAAGKAAYEAAVAKYGPKLTAIHKAAVAVFEMAAALKKEVEKNPKLSFEVTKYSTGYIHELPQSVTAAESARDYIEANDSNYNNKYGAFEPDWSKEAKQIERYILGLKLGTALMAEIDDVLAMIEKLK